MVQLEVIKPSCVKHEFQRHKNFPNLFLNEWKNDNIIFDLVCVLGVRC